MNVDADSTLILCVHVWCLFRADKLKKERSSAAREGTTDREIGRRMTLNVSRKGGGKLSKLLGNEVSEAKEEEAAFNLPVELASILRFPARRRAFLAVVEKKYSPEPFRCWEEVSTFVRAVRNDSLDTKQGKANAVQHLVNTFVRDEGEYA